ncbi:MAG: hypothetical protein EA367_21165 [Leptolyngbya sp. DLM2.Bin15]|nr:MAG: hypothetical protein EA367_21165 [Leptolyngbya sp. DLM2.Bin15]
MISNLSHSSFSSVAGQVLCILTIILPVLGVALMVSAQADESVAETRQGDPIIPPPAYITSSLL